jgi:DNA polymerase
MIYLDFETYNTLDIRKAGTYRYAETCSVLLMAYAIDDEPVSVWDATKKGTEHAKLCTRIMKTEEPIMAHNAMFDRNVLKYALGIDTDIKRWRCSMVKALSLSLPGSLEHLGQAIGLDSDMSKLKDGKKLIQRFCKPAPKNHKADRYTKETHPEEWARFIEYARMDVEAMRHIWKLLPDWNYSGTELDLYHLDQVINDRGFAVDKELAEAAIRATTRCQGRLAEEIDQLTGGKVTKATQRDKLLAHIAEEYDVKLDGLTKADVEAALDSDDIMDPVKRLLVIRQKASKTSAAKYEALINAMAADGRLKGGLQFDGASRTRRWSGRLFQPHNLPRPLRELKKLIDMGIEAMKADCEDLIFDNVMGLAASTLRGVIVAPEGKKLPVSDLSNIEGRVNAWLSNETWKLKAFSDFDKGEGPDLYNLAYAKAFNLPVEKVTDDDRQIGKVMELALGYQGALGAFSVMAKGYGVDLPEKRILQIVKGWRSAHKNIVNMWYTLERAAIKAVKNPDVTYEVERLAFRRKKQWLLMKLPSGQVLCYFRPKLDEEGKLTYMGMNQYTRKWERLSSYGGKLLENATQSLSRDILAQGMLAAEKAGYKIVLTVHDELITETPDTDEFNEPALSKILATNPKWASGLPLAAAGFETYRYRKE